MNTRSAHFIPLLAALLWLLISGTLIAAPGDLDTGFNGTGKATIPVGSSADIAQSVAVQRDGKILVAGFSESGTGISDDFALVRYNSDGSVDTTLDGTGKVTTALGSSDDNGANVAVQTDGKILVAGYSYSGSGWDFALVRYNADGSLDTSFNGTGKVTTATGIGLGYNNDNSVALQADGKILVAGYFITGGKADFAVVRYNSNGALDTSLNGGGKVTTAIGNSSDVGHSVAVQSDGKIVVAGDSYSGSGWNVAVVRYNSNGTLDTSFNSSGKATTPLGTQPHYNLNVALQNNGKIVVAGDSYSGSNKDFAVVRFTADGSLDTTFGGTGKVTTTIGNADDFGASVAMQSDGKILVAGSSYNGTNYDFAVVRYVGDVIAPNIAALVPNPPAAVNGTQSFTIIGQNFLPGCNVTLRNVGTGEVFPNRPQVSQTNTRIVLNPNFTAASARWSVEVINPGGSSSGQFVFDVGQPGPVGATPTALVIAAPESVGGGTDVDLSATLQFSVGAPEDVSQVVGWTVTGGSSGTAIVGRTFSAGYSATPVTATVQASYLWSGGRMLSAPRQITITPALKVDLIPTPPVGVANGGTTRWPLQAVAAVTGGVPPYSVQWRWRNEPVNSNSPQIAAAEPTLTLNTTVGGSTGIGKLEATVTDANRKVGSASTDLSLNKPPAPNQPLQFTSPRDGNSGTLYDSDGVSGPNLLATRKNAGLVVIVHGMNDSVQSGWQPRIAEAVEAKSGGYPGGLPNIVLYDWSKDANPSERFNYDARVIEKDKFLGELGLPPNPLSGLGKFALDIFLVRPAGDRHGPALADWIRRQVSAGKVSPDAPLHLVGHSGGGFVVATCAGELLRPRVPFAPFTKVLATTLDTPMLRRDHITNVKDRGGRIERYNSMYGVLTDGWLPADRQEIYAPMFYFLNETSPGPSVFPVPPTIVVDPRYRVGVATPTGRRKAAGDGIYKRNHNEAYEWYWESVPAAETWRDGFFFSSLLGNTWGSPNVPEAGGPPSTLLADHTLSAFQTFGQVSQAGPRYTLTEVDDAGIFQTLTVPIGATDLKFKLRFDQIGDGDFVAISFGSGAPLAEIDGLATTAGDWTDYELPMMWLAGKSQTLVFRLVSRGASNAVVSLDGIALVMSDDPDGDGLSNAQEAEIGTNPVAFDSDGDGFGDGYELQTTFTNPLQADSDFDGISDYQEVAAGTNPSSNRSLFLISEVTRNANGSVTLRWNGIFGKTYRVQRSSTANFAAFDMIAAGLPGVAPSTSYTDASVPVGAPSMFYRVVMQQ